MAELVLEQDKAIIKLGGGNRIVTAVVIIFFLLVGGSILAFLVNLWAALGFDPAVLSKTLDPANDVGLIVLIFCFLGIAATVIPLIALISLSTGKKRPKEPLTLVFDNLTRLFCVWDQASNHEAYALNQAALPAYGYAQLEGLQLRSYTSSSSSSSGSSTATRHWVVCLKKNDGGLWDLMDSTSRQLAEQNLARLQAAVRFDPTIRCQGDSIPPLPARIQRFPLGGSTLFCWTNRSHFGGIIFGLLFIAGFSWIMLRLAADFLPFLIFGGIICAVILLILLKGLWDGVVSLRYHHCLRLTGQAIHLGLVPKSLLAGARDAEGQTAPGFFADSAALDRGFRSRKSLDTSRVRRVQYNFSQNVRRGTGQELLLLDEDAVRAMETMAGNLMDVGNLLSSAGALRTGQLTITLDGLSVGDAMAFEHILETEILQRGGQVD